MGGTPHGKGKPRPSFEDGALRDPEVQRKLDAGFKGAELVGLPRRSVKPKGS